MKLFQLLKIGPKLPRILESFPLLEINHSIFAFGGSGGGVRRSEVLKLVCENESIGNCQWQEEIGLKFEGGTLISVAVPLPESYDITCEY